MILVSSLIKIYLLCNITPLFLDHASSIFAIAGGFLWPSDTRGCQAVDTKRVDGKNKE